MRQFISATFCLLVYTSVWPGPGSLLNWASAARAPKEKHIGYTNETCSHSAATVNAVLDRIEKQLGQRQITQAVIGELAQIINQDQKNYRAHIIMGNCCDYLGLPEQAIEQYKLAFKYGPDQREACLDLIKSLIETSQWAAASSFLKQAQQKFPIDPHVLLLTGNASFRDGKYAEAEAFYREAMAVSKQPILGLTTALANLRFREGNYIAAMRLADQDLIIDRNFSPANEVSGLALMKMGQFERARPHLKIAFENGSPSFALALDYTQSLIWCGKYNDALIPGLYSLAVASNDQQRDMVRRAINQISMHLAKNTVGSTAQALSHYPVVENSAVAHSQMAKICLNKGLNNLAACESLLSVKLAPQSAEADYELALILESYQHDERAALKYFRQAHVLAPNNYAISQHLMRLEDRLTSSKTDWSWQLKNWIGELAHQE